MFQDKVCDTKAAVGCASGVPKLRALEPVAFESFSGSTWLSRKHPNSHPLCSACLMSGHRCRRFREGGPDIPLPIPRNSQARRNIQSL
ncbi:hypothetical protein AMECASPLE_001968 [Ameca splendens]|uniref:Uncharacterized protein n=1 Tax=Ameca splendens TaxID=208324 RepID=A0ABV0XYI3_9TELE